ncbi:MAG TPA: ABC transporter substrate-binding protein [Bacteroidales bacterium]
MKFQIVIVCFWVVSVFSSCSPDNKKKETRTVFRYNESKGITTLDPAFARNQILIWPVNQLFNGLLEMDDSLRLRPSIAKRWKVSDDGLTYTFYLRRDVYFHDHKVFPGGKGRRVVADDFVYSFSRIIDPKVASPGASIFNDVDKSFGSNGFLAPDDSVFIIRLKTRFSVFPSLLTMPFCFVVPREVVEYYGFDFRNHPVGTGPFMFKTWREGEKLIFVRNPNYFEKDSTGKSLPYLDAISITFINDKQSEFLEFAKGNLDYVWGVQTSFRNELLTRSGKLNPKYSRRFNMEVMPYLNTEYLGCMIDSSKAPESPLLNRNVRLAINYGFDRAKMLKYLRNNQGTPALWGIIPKGLPGFSDKGISYGFDPDLSRRLLAEAGYPEGKGLPEITLTTVSDYLDLCEFIQHDLSQVGIRIKIDVDNAAPFRESLVQSKLQFFRNSWIADYPDAENYLSLFYSRNFCPNGPNYTHFRNKTYDQLYEKVISETDENKRIELYKQMNAIIVTESPIIPLFYDMAVRFYPKNITGFHGNPMNLLKLKRVRKLQ